jgi:peptidoglycan/xylan/chitin deacetylase (PgdA/CDA1 family)
LSWSFSPIAPQDELSADDQECGRVVIEATHGVVPALDATRLTHVGLIETDMFIAQLRKRSRPYVSLDACLRGEGDALTIDDSTRAGLEAARLARKYGHEVTFFLNAYNIAEETPYFFARLSAALDITKAEIVAFEGDEYNLETVAGKQRFRAAVKGRLAQLGSDQDCQDFVSEIGLLLGIDEIVVPEWLRPITTAEVRELAAEGVAMQNHGWTHLLVGGLSPNAYADNIRRGREWLQDVCGAEADFFAVPNGDALPLWQTSADYRAWLMLDGKRRFGQLAPGVFNRRALTGHC